MCAWFFFLVEKIFTFLSKDEVENLKQEEEKKIATLRRRQQQQQQQYETSNRLEDDILLHGESTIFDKQQQQQQLSGTTSHVVDNTNDNEQQQQQQHQHQQHLKDYNNVGIRDYETQDMKRKEPYNGGEKQYSQHQQSLSSMDDINDNEVLDDALVAVREALNISDDETIDIRDEAEDDGVANVR